MSNLLHVGLILIISKVFTVLCLLRLCRNSEYRGNFQNKTAICKLSFQLRFQIYSLLAQTEGKRNNFFGARRGTAFQDYHLVDIRDEKAFPL